MLNPNAGNPNVQGTIAIPNVIINAGARSVLSAAVPGVVAGLCIASSLSLALEAGLVIQYVSVRANLVEMSVFNPTAGNITPAANTFNFEVLQDS